LDKCNSSSHSRQWTFLKVENSPRRCSNQSILAFNQARTLDECNSRQWTVLTGEDFPKCCSS